MSTVAILVRCINFTDLHSLLAKLSGDGSHGAALEDQKKGTGTKNKGGRGATYTEQTCCVMVNI